MVNTTPLCSPSTTMEDNKLPIIYGFPGKTKSAVWQDFGFYLGEDGLLDKSRAVCRICHHRVRYSGNTTNLHTHLTKHRRASVTGVQPGVTLHTAPPGTMRFDLGFHNDCSFGSSDENVVSSGQPVIRNVFSQSNRTDSLHLMVAEYLIENMLPPETVETQSFINLMGLADPNFRLHPKHYYSDDLMSRLYDVYRLSLLDLIRFTSAATLTIESWETTTKQKYSTYTAHIVTHGWNFESYVLCTKPEPANIQDDLDEMRSIMELKSEPLVVLGDSSLITELKSGFVIHCLGLAIEKTAAHALKYKNVPQIIESASKISFLMSEKQPKVTATNAHWISTYELMQQIVQKRSELVANAGLQDVTEMIHAIEEVTNVFKPLKCTIDHMLDQGDLIISLVLPILRKLELSLIPTVDDSELVKDLKTEMWGCLRICYENSSVKEYLLVSSLLDPRFKELLFVDVSDLKRARECLMRAATSVYNQMCAEKPDVEHSGDQEYVSFIEIPAEGVGEPSLKKIKTEVVDFIPENKTMEKEVDWLSDVVNKKTSSTKEESQETVQAEIERYFTVEQTSSQPLSWWQARQTIYPILARVARQYLCTPATSLPLETIFKMKSNDTLIRKSMLSSDLIDKMVFLNANYHKLKE